MYDENTTETNLNSPVLARLVEILNRDANVLVSINGGTPRPLAECDDATVARFVKRAMAKFIPKRGAKSND